jgi:hypothetical protein
MTAEPIGPARWAHDLVDGRPEPAGDSDTELMLSEPFEIRLPIRDTTP